MALPIHEEFQMNVAEESSGTKRAREKLKRQFALLDQQITKEALAQSREKIHEAISRRAGERVLLKDKNISLFDENEHAAMGSKKVLQIMNEIKKSYMS